MRDRIVDALGDVVHSQLLVYLMGPYKAFDLEGVLESETHDGPNVAQIPESIDLIPYTDSDANLETQEAVFDLLLFVRDQLRGEPGVNAFLAVDMDIPLDELDAATQSIQFAFASNAVIYIVPKMGANLGVGIEVGSVLEALYREPKESSTCPDVANPHERVLFIHESAVRSAMISSIRDRWDARVYAFGDREDLVKQIRLFIRDIARRERIGELPTLER